MNKILKTGISLLLFTPLFLSCETVEDVVLPRNDKSTVDISTTAVTVTEGESSTITITTGTPTSKPMQFKLLQTGGNAVEGVDYEFAAYSAGDYGPIGGEVVIAAHESTGSVEIIALTDFEADNKTATFELESMAAMIGVVGTTKEVTVTVANATDDQLTMQLEWDNGVEDDHLCDADFDAYLDTFEAYMFTGNCPEFVDHFVDGSSLVSGVLSDGTHNIVVDYWDDNGVAAGIDFPMKLSVGKKGKFLAVIDLEGLYTTDSPISNGGAGGENVVGKIVVSGGLYSIYDASNTLVYQE
ncbi:hypothetical protein SAMN05216503_0661 [Polaribacter sp. KT25b]|uniref:hypothetical protein n=1 Tax=Polaribacter sp. KT25b TaxID=1855336 RepID=UPI00087C6E28|nr:hypothetical protein [Polaribacter sp. KT25b]SDR73298.1 hypothetical protein SAMN05216503_0661 [Polaribacter sp. KT25b]